MIVAKIIKDADYGVSVDGTNRRSLALITVGVHRVGFESEPLGTTQMDITTILVIVLIIMLLGGGGWYGRGRWYGR